jgi:glutathione S-transferase
MRLYELTWGIYPRRVIIYLAEKGLGAATLERVSLDVLLGENRNPSYLAINPSGTLPTLEICPQHYVRQSSSILEYLEEMFPLPNMIGSLPETRAVTRDMVAMINEAYIQHLTSMRHCSPAFAGLIDQKPDVADALERDYLKALGNIEAIMGETEFLVGDCVTIADCVLFASAQFSAMLYDQPLPQQFSRLNAWYHRFSKRPSAAPPAFPEMLLASAPVTR